MRSKANFPPSQSTIILGKVPGSLGAVRNKNICYLSIGESEVTPVFGSLKRATFIGSWACELGIWESLTWAVGAGVSPAVGWVGGGGWGADSCGHRSCSPAQAGERSSSTSTGSVQTRSWPRLPLTPKPYTLGTLRLGWAGAGLPGMRDDQVP